MTDDLAQRRFFWYRVFEKDGRTVDSISDYEDLQQCVAVAHMELKPSLPPVNRIEVYSTVTRYGPTLDPITTIWPEEVRDD